MTDLVVVLLYGTFALWALTALMRVQAAWEVSQRRTSELREALAGAAAKLLRDLDTVRKLESETARIRDAAAAALREQKERHDTLARSTPPSPPEIHVTSEYPPSRRDTAWIVDFVRDTDLPRQPWEREPMTSLVWAPTQTAALDRARQMTRTYRRYAVASARPLQ